MTEREELLPISEWPWLAKQLREYPNRVDPNKTCCMGALLEMAATIISKCARPTPPADASLVEEAREIAARQYDDEALAQHMTAKDLVGEGLSAFADGVRAGNHDDDRSVRSALAALQNREALIGEMREAAQALVDAVAELPVEDMVEQNCHGEPCLVGYYMQTQGDWNITRRAKDRVAKILDRLPTKDGDGE